MDRQSEAFRLATEADWFGIDLNEAEIYEDGDERPILPPEVFEAGAWDEEREPPKTLAEARAALATRIADPNAPDDESDSGAYDDLED